AKKTTVTKKKAVVAKKKTAAPNKKPAVPRKILAAKRTPADRRRLLNEEEFKKLIETGQVVESDRRSWMDRRQAEMAKDKKKKA
ncbi:MAG: hypothetical protein Q7W05_02870, partial [Deltaproteobacteria bacterium]|nr:hypothetical protein [Deltaproteobacteria bacterium]